MLHIIDVIDYSEQSPEVELQPMIEITIISINLILNTRIIIDYQTDIN